jgi:polysaccharide export outer membrane protein
MAETIMANNPKLSSKSSRATRVQALSVAALFVLFGASTMLRAQISSADASLQPQAQGQTQGQGMAGAAGLRTGGSTAPSVAPEGLSDFKLQPGSLVDIHVLEETDLDGSYRLDGHGQIYVPLAGTINLQSLTLPEAEKAVRAKLETEEILKSPHVMVNIDEYSAQNVVVMGEVSAPGRYPVLGQRKLMDVLAMAGGQTVLAGDEIIIHRAGQPAQVTEIVHYGRGSNDPAALTVEINPGDSVLVKRAGVVYVLGAVGRPGGYLMQEAGQLNVAQVLSLAMGTLPEAKIGDIRVVRKLPDGSMTEIPVHYKKINNAKAAPLQLQAEDVVYVPTSVVKTAFLRGTQVLASAASATIYAAN